MRRIAPLAVLGSGLLLSGPAAAQSLFDAGQSSTDFLRGGFVHLGLAVAHEADRGSLEVDGVPVPGADYVTELTKAASFEAGLYLRGGFSVAVSGMTPMTTSNIASGSLTGYGNLGNSTSGFYSLTANYRPEFSGPIRPYFGGGLGYMHVFSTEDGAITNLKIKSAAGTVLQAGVDIALTDRIGMFADVKRYIIGTEVTGNLGPSIAVAKTRADPWVVSAGLAAYF